MLTKDDILKVLSYNENTGVFNWKVHRNQIATKGSVAGSIAILGKKKTSYLRIKLNNKNYLAHRIAFFIHYNYWPEVVDHKNGNTLDNRLKNLRDADKESNRWNSLPNSNSFSGIKGVYNDRGRWKGMITFKKKKYYLGMFDTKEDAEKLVISKYRELQGDYCLENRGENG